MNNKIKMTNMALVTGFISVAPYNVLAVEKENLLNVEWSAEFGEGGFENFESIVQTSDGGFIVVGEADINEAEGGSRGDAFIIKYDKDGNQEWYNAVIGEDTDLFYSVTEAQDGGYYAVGKSFSSDLDFSNTGNISHAIIVKYDEEGNQEWIKALSDNGKQINYKKIIDSHNDSIAIVGDKVVDGKRTGIFVLIDNEGEEVFSTSIKRDNYTTRVNDFIETKEGNYVLVGTAISEVDSKEVPFVTSINKDGVENWTYIMEKDSDELINILEGNLTSIVEATNGDLIVTGYTFNEDDKDALILDLDKNGNKKWYDIVRGENSDIYTSVMINSKNEIIVSGDSLPVKDANLLKDLNVSVTRYALNGEKIRIDDLSDTIKNISTSTSIMTSDDNMVIVGKSYNKVVGADAKCEVETVNALEECVQANGVIMKVSIKDPVVLPEEDEDTLAPCEINEKPEIKAEDVTIYVGEEFKVFLGVTATDKEEGDITKSIVVTYNNVDTTKAGEYKVIYKVVDECGVFVEKERKVIVKEKAVDSSNNNTPTEKPQTGDSSLIYLGLSSISTLGLITVNKRKEY